MTTVAAELTHECERLPSHEREGQIFWKLRWREGRSQLRHLLTQARLRTSLVVVLSLLFWAGLFVLFYSGFKFVVLNVGPPGATYHAQTVKFVFTLFFVSLQVMLIFSAGIILYGGLYSSQETTFLLTLPVRESRLVFYRFQEALVFSSWGFFLLASPMMVAYGLVVSAPWYYYAYLPGLMISFCVYSLCTGNDRLSATHQSAPSSTPNCGGRIRSGGDRGGLLFHLAIVGYSRRRYARRHMVQGDLSAV